MRSVRLGLRPEAIGPHLPLTLAVLALGVVRYLVLIDGGAPATIDAGNWIAFADSMLGHEYRSSTLVYPPLVPLLTKAAVEVFGFTAGVAVVGAASASLPAVGLYIALRMSGLRGLATAPALLILGASSIGEAAAWGGFPQLIGMALIPLGLVTFSKHLSQRSLRSALPFALTLVGVTATSHFVTVLYSVALLVRVVLEIATEPRQAKPLLSSLRWIWVPAVLSLWLVPTYLQLLQAFVIAPSEFADLNELSWSNLLPRLDAVMGAFPWPWRFLIPLALLAPILTLRTGATPLAKEGLSLIVALLVVLVITREGRYLYFVQLSAAYLASVWLEALQGTPDRTHWQTRPGSRPSLLAPLAFVVGMALAGAQFAASTVAFVDQREFYAVLTPGLVDVIGEIAVVSSPDDTIAVPSLNDAPVGWWVEAMTQRRVIYGSPLRWLNFEDETARASTANDIFRPDFPNDQTLAQLERAHISWAILPDRWAWYEIQRIRLWASKGDLRLQVSESGDASIAFG